MSKKRSFSQDDELILIQYLTSKIKGAYRANESEDDVVDEIIEELIMPKKHELLAKALRYKIRTSYLVDFSE